MNLNFLKKNSPEVQVAVSENKTNLPRKPYSENGPRPKLLWKILVTTFLILGVCLVSFIIFSYQFLTRDRVGVVENSSSSNPKINASKIEKINTFFYERQKAIESAYQKTIVDPGVN